MRGNGKNRICRESSVQRRLRTAGRERSIKFRPGALEKVDDQSITKLHMAYNRKPGDRKELKTSRTLVSEAMFSSRTHGEAAAAAETGG
jgi:hypothetical protein